MRTRLSVLALLAALTAAPSFAASQDRLYLRGGRTRSDVAVLVDGYKGVEVDTNGDGKADETIPSDRIDRIEFGDAPMDYRRGQVAFSQGRYELALKHFLEAAKDKRPRVSWFRQHVNYDIGECLRRLARDDPKRLPEAVKALQRVVDKARGGRMAPPAVYGLGECFLAQGKLDEARRAFEKIESGSYGDLWEMRGKMGLARVLGREGKYADAGELCHNVAASAESADRKDLLRQATLLQGRMELLAGKTKQALDIFLRVAREAEERDVETKAVAYNAIGDALLKSNRPKEALLAYLRVRILYFKAVDALPQALYGATRCFTVLKRGNEARDLVKTLEKKFPKSIWTARAKKALGA